MNLANFLAKILKDLDITNPKTSSQIHDKMKNLLGENWFVLPVNSFTTLAVLLVLNAVLTPLGITPRSIYETLVKELTKLNDLDLLEKIKATLTQYTNNQALPMVTQIKQLVEKFQAKTKLKQNMLESMIHEFLGFFDNNQKTA